MHRWVMVAFALLAVPAPALADVVGPPPARCPAGSIPDTSHAGSNCSPSVCTGNGDCQSGDVCVEQGLCVEGWTGYSHGGQFQVEHAVTTCSADGSCPPNATCVTELRCVSRLSAATGGGSLAVPVAIGAVVAGVLALAVLVLAIGVYVVVSRRRRAARRAGR